jgi:hypothetical protein
MPAGRPPMGPKLVDKFDASDEAKMKLKVIIETMNADISIPEACVKLGIGETRFYELREEALSAALSSLEPGTPGRPRKEVSFGHAEMEALKRKVAMLENDLVTSQTKTMIATAFPHLLKKDSDEKKTNPKEELRRSRKAERRGR